MEHQVDGFAERIEGGRKGGVERTIGVEPSQAIAGVAVVTGEKTADEQLAVGQPNNDFNLVGSAGAGCERRVHGTGWSEPHNAVGHRSVKAVERPHHYRLAVGQRELVVHEDAVAVGRGPRAGVKRGIGSAVGIEPQHRLAREAPGGEGLAQGNEHNLTVGQQAGPINSVRGAHILLEARI